MTEKPTTQHKSTLYMLITTHTKKNTSKSSEHQCFSVSMFCKSYIRVYALIRIVNVARYLKQYITQHALRTQPIDDDKYDKVA